MKAKKKKIVFYTDSFNRGGTEKATLDLINNLDPNKYDLTLIQFFPYGEYRKQLKSYIHKKSIMLFKEYFSNFISWRGRRFFEKLDGKLAHKILIGDGYDIEIACGYEFPTKLISHSKCSKKISWVHMDVSLDKNKVPDMTKEEGQEYFKNIDKIVCVSKDCERKFNEKFGLQDKTSVCYNVVLAEEILEKSKDKTFEFEKENINIVATGRLTKPKGFDRLLKVHNKLIDEGCKHNLYIIGEGEEYETLKQYIKETGIEDTAFLLGYKSNPYPYIKEADIFVCSSRQESFSLVVAESLILGTPVVSTLCTGPVELLNNGEYGLITENDEEALYEGLKKVICDKALREKLSAKALARREFFDSKNSVANWEKILDD